MLCDGEAVGTQGLNEARWAHEVEHADHDKHVAVLVGHGDDLRQPRTVPLVDELGVGTGRVFEGRLKQLGELLRLSRTPELGHGVELRGDPIELLEGLAKQLDLLGHGEAVEDLHLVGEGLQPGGGLAGLDGPAPQAEVDPLGGLVPGGLKLQGGEGHGGEPGLDLLQSSGIEAKLTEGCLEPGVEVRRKQVREGRPPG